MRRLSLLLPVYAIVLLQISLPVFAADEPTKSHCSIYISQIGCIHCARSDPFLFAKILPAYPHVVLIEYELAQKPANGRIVLHYGKNYGGGFYVPQIVLKKGVTIVGDGSILKTYEKQIRGNVNACPLPEGEINAEDLPFNDLPNDPVIWRDRRVIFRTRTQENQTIETDVNLRSVLFSDDIANELQKIDHKRISPIVINYSGGEMKFKNAASLAGWTVQWN